MRFALSRGFVLLEGIIAMLIVAMVSMTALEVVQMLQASVQRFRQSAEGMQARRNALAVVRHAGRTAMATAGSVVYGPYTVSWRSTPVSSYQYRLATMIGLAPEQTVRIHRLTIDTTRSGAVVDRFELMDVAPHDDRGSQPR